jgi:hypothetical protein
MKLLLVHGFSFLCFSTSATCAVIHASSAILDMVENHRKALLTPGPPPTFGFPDMHVIADVQVGDRNYPIEPTSSIRSGALTTENFETESLA